MADKPCDQETSGRDPETGRFLPGHSGNPAGRPKSNLMSLLQAELEKMTGTGLTRSELIVKMLVGLAERGNLQAIDFILRRFAPEKLAVELSGPDKSAIPVEWVQDGERFLQDMLERGEDPASIRDKLQ